MLAVSRVVALACLLAAAPAAAAEDRGPPTLTVTAEGVVTATPDTAIVSAGVVTEAPEAGAALSANNEAMRRLIDAVKAAGVADRDVGTSGFSIDPVMVYPQPKEDGTQDPPRITGYRVGNQVTVRIREIAKAGDLLDQVVRIGANNVQGVRFTVDDDEALLDRARAEAMRTALKRAKVYGEAGGFGIGRIVSVSETGGVMPFAEQFQPRVAMAAKAADSVPIAVGEQEIRAGVSVTFEITPSP
ncbi:SIMPL domain-containing protein [Chthonobacter rhizosphaerae]|uniref:SIMPL domain-containing protein n=1 Tax=Chthonobacter rhizosphaerae TaxID=2735553 RepID=UPI0015EF7551|nr:SIMPL domain-containing protein [Chthonobacter rhizosphaerae]